MVNLGFSDLGTVFNALRDPVRRDLVFRLRLGETSIAVLAASHSISLPAISRHVKILERAGLVRRRKRGREFLLCLQTESLRAATAWIDVVAGASDPTARLPQHLPVRLGDTYHPALSRRKLN
jgi:DNA-binding transcriptional ArsR family regulator